MPVRVLAILSKDPKMPAPEEWFGRCIRSKSPELLNNWLDAANWPKRSSEFASQLPWATSGNNCQKARSSGSKKKCAPLCNAALGCNPREPNMMERTTTNTTGWIFRILPHKTNTIQ